MIKVNTNRRAKFEAKDGDNTSASRPRFISLEDGLPEKEQKSFPSWKDYAEGRFVKTDPSNSYINIAQLENNIDMLINNCASNQTRNKKPSQGKDPRDVHSQFREKHVSSPHHVNRRDSFHKEPTDSSAQYDKNYGM